MKTNKAKKLPTYQQPDDRNNKVEETVSPYYQSGGIAHALALLGLSQPDSVLDAPTDFDMVEIIRSGLTKKAMDQMMAHLKISPVEMSKMLHTSDRTMRRYTSDSLLNPEQSERLIELAKLFAHGIDVFGSPERFRRWLNGPVVSLGGKLPLDLLDTSIGISLVNDTLGRIEYGIVG